MSWSKVRTQINDIKTLRVIIPELRDEGEMEALDDILDMAEVIAKPDYAPTRAPWADLARAFERRQLSLETADMFDLMARLEHYHAA